MDVGEAVGRQVGRKPGGKVHHYHTGSTRTPRSSITATTSAAARIGRTRRRGKTVVPAASMSATASTAGGGVVSVVMDGAAASRSKPATHTQRGKLRNEKPDTAVTGPTALERTGTTAR